MIHAILFDFDGTLANTLPYYLSSYKAALKELGFILPDREVVQRCFGKKEEVVCTSLGIPEKTQKFSELYFNAVKESFIEARLFEGAVNLLEYCQERKIKTAIITFAYRWYIDSMIAQFKLGNLIDLVISNDDIKNPKPDPEAVIKACKVFQIAPENCLVVGDSGSDIKMANAAGSKSVLLHPSTYELFYNLEELKKTNPNFIIGDIKELEELLTVK
jgi:HAD superfamily hydrolase (TIGR01509 family)